MEDEAYKKYTQREHVIYRPDTYIGSIKNVVEKCWVYDNGEKGMVYKEVEYNPGLYKCIDELIVNARDHSEDAKNKVTSIDISIRENTIVVTNNGKGIPLNKHSEYGIYIPELIFGNMLTSTNYDDTKTRTTGGRNGIGAKAANIYSDRFCVDLVTGGKTYRQEWKNRMGDCCEPVVGVAKGEKDRVCIEYTPCYEAFGMKGMTVGMKEMILKRAFDIAVCTDRKVSVTFGGREIPVRTMDDYVNLYLGREAERVCVTSGNWMLGFGMATDGYFQQVSLVNGIDTREGGSHVEHVMTPVLNYVMATLQKKYPDLTIKKNYIRDNVFVCVVCRINNPTFSSQTKVLHTTRVSDFGSSCVLGEDVMKKIVKLGIAENVDKIALAKDTLSLKKIQGKKQIRIKGISKLEDAERAGGPHSSKCVLILTEGDSAKAMAMAGLSVMKPRDREYFGIFPLKGKLLNVRDISPTRVADNEEIKNINTIVGFRYGEEDLSKLRYGRVMIMTDCDVDGSHIKSLIINYICYFWPSYIKSNFLCCFMTPLVKVFRGKEIKQFYNIEDYMQWSREIGEQVKLWRVKYYKGLGTSTKEEACEYFRNIRNNVITYTCQGGLDCLDLVFSPAVKKNTDRRKSWISENIGVIGEIQKRGDKLIDYEKKQMELDFFIDRELVQFSIYDNRRSIPHLMDGLKPSQRKVLYACFKRGLYRKSDGSGEIKVSQLSGYVSEHTAYHHGEVSLQGTIVHMAQTFVGCGNLNFLVPEGMFGTRLEGGSDCSSARYIFTYLNPELKTIFREEDLPLLNYLNEDGMLIEPEYYVPVLPTILLNGTQGIGTGWSSNIPCFRMEDVRGAVLEFLQGKEITPLVPWYRGFKGTVVRSNTRDGWITRGCWKVEDNKITITELPIGMWVTNYRIHLDKLEEKGVIDGYQSQCTDSDIMFVVNCKGNGESVVKDLKLESSLSSSNFHCFDENGVIRKYDTPEDIVRNFCRVRAEWYGKRYTYLLQTLGNRIKYLLEKKRFVVGVMDSTIKIFRESRESVIGQLEKMDFVRKDDSYEWLVGMKLTSFTLEKIAELDNQISEATGERNRISQIGPNDLWLEDLNDTPFPRLNLPV